MASVTIYTTPTCHFCHMTKEFFQANKVEYIEKDVATDARAREEMMNKSHQLGVPVIDIDGQIIVGFQKDKLKQLLNLS